MLVVVVDGIVRGAAADGASAKGKWIAHFTNGTGKTELAVPKEFVITNDTLDSVLYNLATERGEFLFTSFFLPTGDDNASAAIDVLKNFCSFVSKAGALRHLLILTHDARCAASTDLA